jgi:hypothetical protein
LLFSRFGSDTRPDISRFTFKAPYVGVREGRLPKKVSENPLKNPLSCSLPEQDSV